MIKRALVDSADDVTRQELRLVQDWFQELAERVPTN